MHPFSKVVGFPVLHTATGIFMEPLTTSLSECVFLIYALEFLSRVYKKDYKRLHYKSAHINSMALLCKAFLLLPILSKHKAKSKRNDTLQQAVGDPYIA